MEVEARQVEVAEQFCLLAKSARGRAAAEIVAQATADPALFAFGELLHAPHIQELQGTEHAYAWELLQLFAYGTWADFRAAAHRLPPLQPQQVLKLKQLTVMTLAEKAKVVPYDVLMAELHVTNVRELEDLLINDCMYAGIVRGKLDQRRRCFEVQFSAGRDLRPGQLDNLISTLSNWQGSAERLLTTIQEKIKWADSESESHARHRKKVEDRAADIRRSIQTEMELRGQTDLYGGEGGSALMDFVEDSDRSRPKRRR